jgi:tetratricopeptide (TPR) repeat protein
MKRVFCFLIIGVLIILSVASCGKKVAPATLGRKTGKSYDIATFNYVYVEAIKQKLLGNGGDALAYLEQCIKLNPLSDAAYYQMGQIVIANGDMSNGKKFVLNAVKIDQKNFWYLMSLADIYYKEKNLDSAIIYYEKAVEFFPDKEDLQLTLGNLYSENKNYDKAKTLFDSFDKKYGVNESSTLSSIKSLMASQDYDGALIKAELLIKEFPEEYIYNGLLAEIYVGKGENDKALDVYIQLIERDPDNPQIQLSFCDFLIREKSYDELFLLLNTIILNNQIGKDDKISLLAHLIDLPDLLEQKANKLFLAIMVLEANYKDDDIVLILRPELQIKLNDFVGGAARLNEIIKNKPDDYYAWEKLLLVYLQMKDYDQLLIKGEECATRFNRSFTAKILYANGAMEKEKYSIALEELRKAEILAGDNIDYKMQVLTMRADAYYRMKDFIKAFETFEEALRSNNGDLTVLNNYAYYLAEQDMKLNEAEEMAKRVIKIEGKNTTFLDTYGWVLYKRGKLKEAAAVMETILKSGEKPDPVWYEHYGYILKKQKKCDAAIENWNIALKLDGTKTSLTKEIEDCKK